MAKRMALMLFTVVLILGGIGAFKYFQIKKAIAAGASFQQPPEAVTTIVAEPSAWAESIDAIGTIAAVNGVVVTADLPGIVSDIRFSSGASVRKGEILATLDSRQEQATLVSAEAKRELDRRNLDRARGLTEQKVIAQADLDAAEAAFDQSKASVEEIKATIDRKIVRAPFSGVLGIREINLGQYLESGAPIVPLQSLDPIYVNFSVPQQEIGAMRPGGPVRVRVEQLKGETLEGKISAVNAVVDEGTRTIQVQGTLANPKLVLRPGMFARAEVPRETSVDVIPLPASAISYAPYGDSVFIVESMKDKDGKEYKGVRQQFVKLGGTRGDQIAVTSGVKPGEEVVTSGAFKLRNGASVQVNNDVKPTNDPAPKPEDN